MFEHRYRINKDTGCWQWRGPRAAFGYGRVRHNGKYIPAHRLVYQLYNGPIPEGMVVRHKCDNPPCVNPDHLELGTPLDNVKDWIERGRTPTGRRNPSVKLTEEQVREIRRSDAKGTDLAARYGVNPPTISKIRSGQLWPSLEWLEGEHKRNTVKRSYFRRHTDPSMVKVTAEEIDLIRNGNVTTYQAWQKTGLDWRVIERIREGKNYTGRYLSRNPISTNG